MKLMDAVRANVCLRSFAELTQLIPISALQALQSYCNFVSPWLLDAKHTQKIRRMKYSKSFELNKYQHVPAFIFQFTKF